MPWPRRPHEYGMPSKRPQKRDLFFDKAIIGDIKPEFKALLRGHACANLQKGLSRIFFGPAFKKWLQYDEREKARAKARDEEREKNLTLMKHKKDKRILQPIKGFGWLENMGESSIRLALLNALSAETDELTKKLCLEDEKNRITDD